MRGFEVCEGWEKRHKKKKQENQKLLPPQAERGWISNQSGEQGAGCEGSGAEGLAQSC